MIKMYCVVGPEHALREDHIDRNDIWRMQTHLVVDKNVCISMAIGDDVALHRPAYVSF